MSTLSRQVVCGLLPPGHLPSVPVSSVRDPSKQPTGKTFPYPLPPLRFPSSPAHVRPVEALRRVVLRSPVLVAHRAARLLCGRDLGLQRGGVRVDPLELGEVPVEHADDLAQLREGGGGNRQ